MKVTGIKATGFSSGRRSRQHEVEMASDCETITRRGDSIEYSVTLRGNTGDIHLTLDETEIRDWHTHLSYALNALSTITEAKK
jgi:hypothetical protein